MKQEVKHEVRHEVKHEVKHEDADTDMADSEDDDGTPMVGSCSGAPSAAPGVQAHACSAGICMCTACMPAEVAAQITSWAVC